MKKNKRTLSANSPFDPLDQYEKQILESVEDNKFVASPDSKQKVKKYQRLFDEQIRNDKRITIRVNSNDLAEIKNKALEHGVPYQTLINVVLRKYVKGKIDIRI